MYSGASMRPDSDTSDDDQQAMVAVKSSTSIASTSAMWMRAPQTVLVLDWDDTLFPTTWLCGKPWFRAWIANKGHPDEMEQADKTLLTELDKAVQSFIVTASCLGHICCVTLARRPWQARTMETFYPRLTETWQRLGLKVRYAKEERCVEPSSLNMMRGLNSYSETSMEQMLQQERKYVKQKMKAMQRFLKEFYMEGSWKNVVSIGDGLAERQALKELGLKHMNPVSRKSGVQKEFRIKTIQMVSNPSCEQLVEQMQVLTSWLPSLVCLDRDFDVDFNSSEEDLFDTQAHIANLLEVSE